MPKWTDYTIKTEPADNDEVMVLDTAGKANKRLGLSALSDWVIGKIANKVFENLQTNNKTVLGAINELNSKTLAPRGNITESLDNYKTTDSSHLSGVYLIDGYDVFNDGFKKWGILILFQYQNVQLMIIEGGNIYARDWSGDPLQWTKWRKYTNSTL